MLRSFLMICLLCPSANAGSANESPQCVSGPEGSCQGFKPSSDDNEVLLQAQIQRHDDEVQNEAELNLDGEESVVSAHRVNGTEGYLPCSNTNYNPTGGQSLDSRGKRCWYSESVVEEHWGDYDVDPNTHAHLYGNDPNKLFQAREMCCLCGGGLREANHHWNVRPTDHGCPAGAYNTNLGGTTVKFYSNIATSWQCAQKCWYHRTATHFVYGTAAPRLKKCWCKTGVSTKRTFAGVMAGTPCERCSDMAPINGDVGPNLNLDGSTIHTQHIDNEVACSNLCKGLHRPATHYVFQPSSKRCWCKGKQNSGQSPVTKSFSRAGVNSGKLC